MEPLRRGVGMSRGEEEEWWRGETLGFGWWVETGRSVVVLLVCGAEGGWVVLGVGEVLVERVFAGRELMSGIEVGGRGLCRFVSVVSCRGCRRVAHMVPTYRRGGIPPDYGQGKKIIYGFSWTTSFLRTYLDCCPPPSHVTYAGTIWTLFVR